MSPGHCSCPECGTILRVRDRSFIGRQIDCPDCQTKLVLKLNDDRSLVAERHQPDVARPASSASMARQEARSAVRGKLAGVLQSPLVVAWALAIGVTAFAGIMLLRPSVRFRATTGEDSQPITELNPSAQPSVVVDPASDASAIPPEPLPANVVEVPVVTPAPAIADNSNHTPKPAVVPLPEKPVPVAVTPAPEIKPVVPVVPKIDVEELLKQPLSRFATRTPTSRLALIEQLEELTGVPIRYDRQELGEKNLLQAVTISVDTTTVGGVLKVLLDAAGWEYAAEDNGIRLKPRQVAGPATP